MTRKAIFVFNLLLLTTTGCRHTNLNLETMPTVQRSKGHCADTGYDGVWSESGERRVKRADRDLNSDGSKELVIADQRLCSKGHCYWNVFVGPKECQRYIGTIAAKTIRLGKVRGPGQFREVVGHWPTRSPGRFFKHRYLFEYEGYELEEALLCKYVDDGVVECAQEPDRDLR